MPTGQLLLTIPTDFGVTWAAAFSADGRWLATGGGEVRLLSAATETESSAPTRTVAPVARPKSLVEPLVLQAEADARGGHWKEAVADFTKALEINPGNHLLYHSLVPLLVATGDREAYDQHCQRLLTRFGGTGDPVIAERMVKDCLILRSPGVDFEAVNRMAQTAITVGEKHPYLPFFQFCKGLAEYRQDRFASAAEWMQKVLNAAGHTAFRDVEAWLVLAMAQNKQNQPDEARASLSKAIEALDIKMPKLDSGDLGGGWNDWIISHALFREAKGAIDGATEMETAYYRKKAEAYRRTAESGDIQALNGLAWLLATCANPAVRDGDTAVKLAQTAVAATNRKDPTILDTLAAAYAETGQFTNAVSAQKAALVLLQDETTKRVYTNRLRLYESTTPYREGD